MAKLKQTESQLQKACIQLLQYKRLPYIRNNSFAGMVTRFNGSSGYIQNNSFPGSPDILVFLPGGKTLHVELKSATGRQSEPQKHYERMLTDMGHNYNLIREVTELEKLIAN